MITFQNKAERLGVASLIDLLNLKASRYSFRYTAQYYLELLIASIERAGNNRTYSVKENVADVIREQRALLKKVKSIVVLPQNATADIQDLAILVDNISNKNFGGKVIIDIKRLLPYLKSLV